MQKEQHSQTVGARSRNLCPYTTKRTAVFSDLPWEWMPLVLFRNQKLSANVVDDKLCGLYFISSEMNTIVPSEMKKY